MSRSSNLGQVRTNMLERMLLIATIGVLPLQWYYPTVFGMSLGFIVFLITAGYLMIFRMKMLREILFHPVFLAGYAMIGLGLFIETVHGGTGYSEILRIFFMLFGAIIIATLCRDRKALYWAMYGFLIAGVWLSFILIQTTYGTLSTAKADDFLAVSHLREDLFHESLMGVDPNTMAFFAAQGVIVALGMGLMARSHILGVLFFAVGAFCLVAAFLPMSRGGILIFLISSAMIIYSHGIMKPKILLAAGLLTLGIMVWVPEIVFTRMTLSVDTNPVAREEGRTRVYSAVVQHFPEFVLTGVGISHFWGNWGKKTKLWKDNKVSGTHNCFAQITVYWGVLGLLALLAVIWQAIRCFPRGYGRDVLTLCLLGVGISVLLQSMLIHTLYSKEFSLILGLLAGGSFWIWPDGVIQGNLSPKRKMYSEKHPIRSKATVAPTFHS